MDQFGGNMKDKIYEAYKNKDKKSFDRIINNLSNIYHDSDSFRIIDMCNDFDITCGEQRLSDDVTSYGGFNSDISNKYNTDKFIIVSNSIGLKKQRMHFAYHFFQYVLNNKEENYEVIKNIYTNRECYENACNLLLPEKRFLKDYNMLTKFYGMEHLAIMELSDKYLVPYDDVKNRIVKLLMKRDNKKIKII